MKPTVLSTKVSTPESAKQNRRRFLLPSGRVAEFLFPNVGQFLEIREKALVLSSTKCNGGEPNTYQTGFEMRDLAMRRLLVGLSQPVPPIYKKGFNEEVEFERLKSDGVSGDKLELALEHRKAASEDVDAMKEAAVLEPITDYEWDNGKLLSGMRESEPGSEGWDDWESLNDAALQMVQSFESKDQPDPKAQARKIRRLR